MTTKFVGEYYEVTGTEVTKYYGGAAMRKGGTLYYLLADHLGSNSLILDTSGAVVGETRYTAWGEERYSSGTVATDYTYTGQYSNTNDFGWMYYKARWYDAALGRFAQADSIVPGAANPLAWDRYAYGLNDPVKYRDPSGHSVDCGIGESYCEAGKINIQKRALDFANDKRTNRIFSGATLYWEGLENDGQSILTEAGWTPGEYQDHISRALSPADPIHDPAMWIASIPLVVNPVSGILRTICLSKSGCSSFIFGIQPFNEMPPEFGYERHHLLEVRFANILGVDPNTIPSVYLTPEEHRYFTYLWRQQIGYNYDRSPITTSNATINMIWTAIRNVYNEYPAYIEASRQFLFQ